MLVIHHPLNQIKSSQGSKKILEEEEITLNGRAMTEEIYKVIEAMYWDAKEQNRRK